LLLQSAFGSTRKEGDWGLGKGGVSRLISRKEKEEKDVKVPCPQKRRGKGKERARKGEGRKGPSR